MKKSRRIKLFVLEILSVALILSLTTLFILPKLSSQTQATETQAASTEPPQAESSATSSPMQANPLNLQNYEAGSLNEAVNTFGDVFLAAKINPETIMDGRYISGLQLTAGSGSLYFDCLSSSEPYISNVGPGEDALLCAGTISPQSGDVTMQTFLSETTSLTHLPDGFLVLEYVDDGCVYSYYNAAMHVTDTLTLANTFSVNSSTDGQRIYYTEDNKLFLYGSEPRVLSPDIAMRASYLLGVLTDAQGVDHLLLSATTGDLQSHTLILNAETGETEYITDYENAYAEVIADTYIEHLYDNDYTPVGWIVGYSGNTFDYSTAVSGDWLNLFVPESGLLLFTKVTENHVSLSLFDADCGECIASTQFAVPAGSASGDSSDPWEDYSEGAYIASAASLTEGEILLTVGDGADNTYYYLWKLNTQYTDALVTVTAHEMGSRPSLEIDELLDLSQYMPSEVNEALVPLRERSDSLEAQFGVEILIGEECADYIGGYAISPQTEYSQVELALNILETELKKYPANFFTQLERGYTDMLVLYLAGTLNGVSGETLSVAGGFQCEYNGNSVIVLDVSDSQYLATVIHHELFHVIEAYMECRYWRDGIASLDEGAWQALNPPDTLAEDIYTMDYSQFGFPEYYSAAYDMLSGEDVSGAYFVDTYSMTYAKEDRARIFECAMSDYYGVNFEAAPHLRAKRDYLAQCIRLVFDSAGWETLPWEA